MKPELEEVLLTSSHSFTVRVVKRSQRPLLSKAWHYHPEIEICYTPKSNGVRYVGNTLSDYHEHDLVILGSNLPHGFTTLESCEQYVIQFKREFLGSDFFKAAELHSIRAFLELAQRGLRYTGEDIKKLGKKIIKLSHQEKSSFTQLLALLKLLKTLSESGDFKPICTEKYSTLLSTSKLNNISTIFSFIEANFQNEITIEEVSRAVNLTESAFYKFVKRHTNKKFTTILNEYRAEHAYRLLAGTDLAISEISYQSGYRNLSYFNRVFKKIYKMTPREFRSQQHKEVKM